MQGYLKFMCVVAFMCLLLGGCDNLHSYEEKILQMRNHTICLPLDSMEYRGNSVSANSRKHSCLKLVVYSDTTVCSSCRLKEMWRWKPFLDSIKGYQGKLEALFIFYPLLKDRKAFDFDMKSMLSYQSIYVDTSGVFLRKNPHILKDAAFHTFLLDENDSVILVGTPIDNVKMCTLFWRTVEERLGKPKDDKSE